MQNVVIWKYTWAQRRSRRKGAALFRPRPMRSPVSNPKSKAAKVNFSSTSFGFWDFLRKFVNTCLSHWPCSLAHARVPPNDKNARAICDFEAPKTFFASIAMIKLFLKKIQSIYLFVIWRFVQRSLWRFRLWACGILRSARLRNALARGRKASAAQGTPCDVRRR